MNLQKLVDAAGTGPEFEYEKEIAERLEAVLGSWLSLPECFALLDLLAYHNFRFEDGFVISDNRDPNKIIGIADASAIVSCFRKEPEQDWLWFKVKYPGYPLESEAFQAARTTLLARILTVSHEIFE